VREFCKPSSRVQIRGGANDSQGYRLGGTNKATMEGNSLADKKKLGNEKRKRSVVRKSVKLSQYVKKDRKTAIVGLKKGKKKSPRGKKLNGKRMVLGGKNQTVSRERENCRENEKSEEKNCESQIGRDEKDPE